MAASAQTCMQRQTAARRLHEMGVMPILQKEACAGSEWRGIGCGTCFCLCVMEPPPRAGWARVYRAGWPHASMLFSDTLGPGMLRPHW